MNDMLWGLVSTPSRATLGTELGMLHAAPANHLPPTTRSAFLPDLACRVPYSLLHFTEWLSTVSETLDNFVTLS